MNGTSSSNGPVLRRRPHRTGLSSSPIRAYQALREVEPDVVSAWCLHAMDSYDKGRTAGRNGEIRDLGTVSADGHQRAAGSPFEEAVPVLLPFIAGDWRPAPEDRTGDFAWTDGEVLPARDRRASRQPADNFQLFKAIVAHLGTDPLRHPEPGPRQPFSRPVIRRRGPCPGGVSYSGAAVLDAYRRSSCPACTGACGRSAGVLDTPSDSPDWRRPPCAWTGGRHRRVEFELLGGLYAGAPPQPRYQGQLNLQAAWDARRRLERDKARLRESMRVIAEGSLEAMPAMRHPSASRSSNRRTSPSVPCNLGR